MSWNYTGLLLKAAKVVNQVVAITYIQRYTPLPRRCARQLVASVKVLIAFISIKIPAGRIMGNPQTIKSNTHVYLALAPKPCPILRDQRGLCRPVHRTVLPTVGSCIRVILLLCFGIALDLRAISFETYI